MSLNSGFPQILEFLSLAMLLFAILISREKTVARMIPLYQGQSLTLALVTFLAAFEEERLIVMFVVVLPVFLMLSIEALLAQATVPEDIPITARIRHLMSDQIRRETHRQAMPIWLKPRRGRRSEVASLVGSLILIVVAYTVGFSLVGQEFRRANSLAVSIALLLLGLFTMTNREDIISQIMGLLVMEHGLFLAAVRLVPIPSAALIFVISLFLYIIITLTILVFLLPELHRSSGSIEVEDQRKLRG